MKFRGDQPIYRAGITFKEYLRYELNYAEALRIVDIPDNLVEELYAVQYGHFQSWLRYSINKKRHEHLMVELGFNPHQRGSKYR
jgi:hypothetical protein